MGGRGILACIDQTLQRFLELDDRGDHAGALAALSDAFARFNEGEREVLFDILAPDVEWLFPEIFPIQGFEPGHEGIQAFLDDQAEQFDGWAIEPEDYVRNGDRVAVLVRQRGRGRASGVEIEIRVAQLWTIRDNLVVRFEGVANHDDARRMIAAQ